MNYYRVSEQFYTFACQFATCCLQHLFKWAWINEWINKRTFYDGKKHKNSYWNKTSILIWLGVNFTWKIQKCFNKSGNPNRTALRYFSEALNAKNNWQMHNVSTNIYDLQFESIIEFSTNSILFHCFQFNHSFPLISWNSTQTFITNNMRTSISNDTGNIMLLYAKDFKWNISYHVAVATHFISR